MGNSKYKNGIILIAIYYGFLGLFFGVIADVPDRALILLVFLVLFPLAAFLGVFLGGYLLSPLFLFIHKNILGRKMVYDIEDKDKGQKFGKTWRGIFPALMALTFTIGFVFDKSIQNTIMQIFNPSVNTEVDVIMNTFMMLLIAMIFVSTLLFGSIWFLLDSCVVYSNVEKVKDTDQPTETKSVGGYFQTLLKGYAGIGALIAYYTFAIAIMDILSEGKFDIIMFIVAGLFYAPFPILVAIAILPSILLADVLRNQRIEYVKKWAKKFGITE